VAGDTAEENLRLLQEKAVRHLMRKLSQSALRNSGSITPSPLAVSANVNRQY
jgi:hypothetical protein